MPRLCDIQFYSNYTEEGEWTLIIFMILISQQFSTRLVQQYFQLCINDNNNNNNRWTINEVPTSNINIVSNMNVSYSNGRMMNI